MPKAPAKRNEYGYAAPVSGTFSKAQSVDNVFLYNPTNDCFDIDTTGISSSRLDPAKNVCQIAHGTYAKCSLLGFTNT